MTFSKKRIITIFSSLIFIMGQAQELEPRAITNLPVGTNFLVGSYNFSNGDILLDPAINIRNLDANIHSTVLGYARSINFFGLSGKFDALIPFAFGDWRGDLAGSLERVSFDGLGDARLRFSFNFLNSPAMNVKEFQDYDVRQVSGVSIQIVMPTGQYDPEELVNLGSNRWAIKPQWGYAMNLSKWIFEGYASIWFYTKNSNYLNGNELAQDPLYTFKLHMIRKLPKSMWVSANMGYGIGGKSYINGNVTKSYISTARLGLFYAIPFGFKHSLKLAYVTGFRFEKGSDFDAFSISYQYRWNNSLNQEHKQ